MIERVGKITDSVDVAPVKVFGQTCRIQVGVRFRTRVVIVNRIWADLENQKIQRIFSENSPWNKSVIK